MGWKRDLTRECVEPNPGFDRAWKEGEGTTWLDSLKAKYPFAPRFAKYSGEELFTFTLDDLKALKLGDDADVTLFYRLIHKEGMLFWPYLPLVVLVLVGGLLFG